MLLRHSNAVHMPLNTPKYLTMKIHLQCVNVNCQTTLSTSHSVVTEHLQVIPVICPFATMTSTDLVTPPLVQRRPERPGGAGTGQGADRDLVRADEPPQTRGVGAAQGALQVPGGHPEEAHGGGAGGSDQTDRGQI